VTRGRSADQYDFCVSLRGVAPIPDRGTWRLKRLARRTLRRRRRRRRRLVAARIGAGGAGGGEGKEEGGEGGMSYADYRRTCAAASLRDVTRRPYCAPSWTRSVIAIKKCATRAHVEAVARVSPADGVRMADAARVWHDYTSRRYRAGAAEVGEEDRRPRPQPPASVAGLERRARAKRFASVSHDAPRSEIRPDFGDGNNFTRAWIYIPAFLFEIQISGAVAPGITPSH